MNLKPMPTIAVCLVVAGLVGFFVSGPLAVMTFIGLDPAAFPAGALMQTIGEALLPSLSVTLAGAVLFVGAILLVAIASFFVVRASSRAQVTEESRRTFLTGSLAGAAGAVGAAAVGGVALAGRAIVGVGNDGRGWDGPLNEIFGGEVVKTHPEWKDNWRGSKVESYRRFGRTEFQISDIVMGTGPLKGSEGERIVKLGIERGINYIDTAPDYSGSGSEQIIGRSITGLRDKIFLTTKFCTPLGHLPADASVTDYKSALEASLGRLQTDYVDMVHVHSCDEVDRLMSENMHEAFDRLKEEGKVQYLGFSSHTPNLVEVANEAIDSGRFDVMMLAYHHGIWPKLSEVIDRAATEQDMGVVAMKTLKGAKHRGLAEFDAYADSYAQAALKWVHANPNVSTAVISMFKMQHIDEYLYASGKKMTERDLAVLGEYDKRVAGTYCSPHCGVCHDSCPEGVPIADVLRQRMYFEDYGVEKQAMSLYADLEVNASVCAGCSAPCLGSCPLGISIQDRTAGAHELLQFG
ncbi:MAG: putative aldo/keto reductase-like oxidoreductase [Myxococcota bacterium]|jgi:predicted aldo/keto reductase-like oxidoreductase